LGSAIAAERSGDRRDRSAFGRCAVRGSPSTVVGPLLSTGGRLRALVARYRLGGVARGGDFVRSTIAGSATIQRLGLDGWGARFSREREIVC
jgi:hypothetical protein